MLDLTSIANKDYHRVCSQHFPDADSRRDPQLNIGRHLASPKKQGDRNKRTKRRESISNSSLSFNSDQDSGDASKTESVVASYVTFPIPSPMITGIGEQLLTDFQVHEIPTIDACTKYFIS